MYVIPLHRNHKLRVQLLKFEAFGMPCFGPVPKFHQILKPQIIIHILPAKINDEEGYTALAFKILHKYDLMLMDIGQRKGTAAAVGNSPPDSGWCGAEKERQVNFYILSMETAEKKEVRSEERRVWKECR